MKFRHLILLNIVEYHAFDSRSLRTLFVKMFSFL